MQTEEIERTAADVAVRPGAPPINQDLITLDPKRYVALVYAPHHNKLDALIAESAAVVIDCTTTAGLAIATKWRALFRDEVRGAAESTRVERKAPILMIGRLIDSEAQAIQAEAKKHEDRFDAAIKAEAARKAAVKAAEEIRKEAIRLRVVAIRELPLQAVGKSAAEIGALIAGLVGAAPDESFEHLLDAANAARTEALDKLAKAEAAQRGVEVEAEARRQQEARDKAQREEADRRIAAERAELAELRAAAKAQATALAEAERKAKTEADRIAAEAQAKIDAQLAALAQQKAAADARDAAAAAKAQAEADRIEQELADLARDAEIAARPVPAVFVADDPAPVVLAAIPFTDEAEALPMDELDPTDEEIKDMGKECGLTLPEWVERLRVFVAAHEGMAEVAA